MSIIGSKKAAEPSPETSERKIVETERSTQRKGNYVEILGDFKPLDRDWVPSNMATPGKKSER
jgi:ribosomal protein S16